MPISLAGMLTVVIFAFALVTQEFVYGVTFITAGANYTGSVGVPTFLVRGDVYFWGSMMAACLIASLPIAHHLQFLRRPVRRRLHRRRGEITPGIAVPPTAAAVRHQA